MIEFLKELVKEPESVKKYVLTILNFVLLAIVTSKFYIYFFGMYEPVLIGDTNFWHDIYNFLITGKILLVAFLFFVLKYIVFELFSTVVYLIIYFITSKVKKSKSTFKDSSLFRGLLSIFGVLKHNPEKNIIETGRHFDNAYSILISHEKAQIIEQFDKIKNSLLYEFFTIYSAFTLIYFFILEDNSRLFDTLIIIIFILILYLIFTFQYIYELICANYDDLVFGIKILKQIEITKNLLEENQIKIETVFHKTFANFITFKINDSEFAIEHFLGSTLVFEKIKESHLIKNSKLILITSKKLPILLEKKLYENSKITLLEFKNDEIEFIQKLEDVLFNNKSECDAL